MSTLESAICFTLVLFVLCLLIVMPMQICIDTLDCTNTAIEDVLDDNDGFISSERLNTFLVGISDNYRIIYDTVIGEVVDEE